MYTLPFIAVLVAVACAGPVPQSTPLPVADVADGASTPMTDPAMSGPGVGGGLGGIGGMQSSSSVRPSRHTLKPFSPRTRTTPQTAGAGGLGAGGLGGAGAGGIGAPGSASSHTPFAARTTPAGQAGQIGQAGQAGAGASRTPFTLKPFSRRTTPAGGAGAGAGASRTPFTLKPFSPRNRVTPQTMGGMGGMQSTPRSPNAPVAETSVNAAEPTVAGQHVPAAVFPERIVSTPEAVRALPNEAAPIASSESPIPNRGVRDISRGEWNSMEHPEWQLAETSSTMKAAGIQDPAATTPLNSLPIAERLSTPENRIGAAGASSTPISPAAGAADAMASTPMTGMRIEEKPLSHEHRLGSDLSSSSLAPSDVAATTPLNNMPVAERFTPENRIGAAGASSTPLSPAAGAADIASTTPLNAMPIAERLSTPENRIGAAGASTPFNKPGGIGMSSSPSTPAGGINGPSTASTPLNHHSTPSTTLNPANPLNRAVRSMPEHDWQLAESSSAVSITSEMTTSGSFKISEPTTLSTTPSTSAPLRRRRSNPMENPEGWQMAEASSTMEVPADMTTTFSDPDTTAFEDVTPAADMHESTLSAFEDVTPAADMHESTLSTFEDSTTSAFDVTPAGLEIGNSEDGPQPGWQLAETSSTLEIGSTTPAMHDIPSSTPAVGMSFDEQNWGQ